jgi:hypothetical protein
MLYDSRYSEAGSKLRILALGMALCPLQIIRSGFTATGDRHFVVELYGVFGAILGIALYRLFAFRRRHIPWDERKWMAGAADHPIFHLWNCFWRRTFEIRDATWRSKIRPSRFLVRAIS